jgi:hypothetical protein
MVAFEVRDAGGRARRAGEDLLDDVPALGVLDTGASSFVLSTATAERFGVAAEPGARFVETGMTGEHAMAVSRPVGLAVLGGGGQARAPSQRRAGSSVRPATPAPALALGAQRLLVQDPLDDDPMALLLAPGRAVDVIGMPAIREAIVVMEPSGTGAAAVRLEARGASVAAEVWVPLTLRDFNRRTHPKRRGPLPALAPNPMLRVLARRGTSTATGEWILDTGSVVSIVSSATARSVGLVDAAGRPARPPEFTLPIGGISGEPRMLPGFSVESLELGDGDAGTVVLAGARVVVHDVATTTDDGRTIVLDGLLGMNVFLDAGSGAGLLGFAASHRSGFARIVIDAGRERLGLTPAR